MTEPHSKYSWPPDILCGPQRLVTHSAGDVETFLERTYKDRIANRLGALPCVPCWPRPVQPSRMALG